LTSVKPALSIAGALDRHVGAGAHGDTDVGLRQCRCIVDAVAGHCHLAALGLQLLDDARLVRRQHVGADFVDTQASGDRTRGAFVVAGGHDDGQSLGVQRLERFEGGFLDRVGDAHQAGDLVADEDEHHRFALVAAGVGRFDEGTAVLAEIGEQRGVAECNGLAVDHALDALAGQRLEFLGIGQFDATRFSAGDDRLGQRMFRSSFEAGCEAQHFVFLMAGSGQHGYQLRLANGQRAGLVDDQGVHLGKAFERLGVLD